MSKHIVEEPFSLAQLVLDTISRLQSLTQHKTSDPLLQRMSIREVVLSVAYEQDPKKSPIEDRDLDLSLVEARAFLLRNDCDVFLGQDRLSKLPPDRITQLRIRVRL